MSAFERQPKRCSDWRTPSARFRLVGDARASRSEDEAALALPERACRRADAGDAIRNLTIVLSQIEDLFGVECDGWDCVDPSWIDRH